MQVDLAGRFSTGPLTHQAVVGADFDHSITDTFIRTGALSPTRFDLYTPDYTQQPAALAPSRDQVLRVNRPNFDVNDQVRLWGNRIILNGGIRASTYSQGDSQAIYPGRFRTPAPKLTYNDDWTYQPRAGRSTVLGQRPRCITATPRPFRPAPTPIPMDQPFLPVQEFNTKWAPS